MRALRFSLNLTTHNGVLLFLSLAIIEQLKGEET
jgi:hypothetical protein